ncbi:MAG: PEGA domain-containing protein [Methanolinea tarda]
MTPTQPVTPAPATTTAPASDLCSLCLESDPASALVTIDGIDRGVTPICVPLAPGTHRITISKEGYVPWEGEITTGASQTLSLPVFSLRPVARFVVEAGCSPGGAVLPEGPVRVPKGGTVEFLFVPERGYELVDVLVDGRSIGPHPRTRLEGISRNHTVRGVFSPVTPSPPVAAILANSTEGVAPLAVQFKDVSEGDVANRSWDFGDGTSSTDPSPVHVFYEPGNYTVTLGVCGRGGCNLSAPSCLIVVREGNTGGNGTSGESEGGGVTPGADDDNPPLIGGSTGFLRVRCPVEGASVFIDGDYRGEIRNGTLDILIYLTGTPCRAVTVKAPGYLPATVPISRYPDEGETVVIEVAPILIGPSPGVFEGQGRSSPLPGNATPTIPSFSSG